MVVGRRPLVPATPPPAAAPAAAAPPKKVRAKKAPPPPPPPPKKGKDWAAFAAAVALCVTALIMSQNDKEVSMAQIASAGKGPIPAIPAKGGNNIPDWKQQPQQNAATSPPPVQSAQENLRTFVFTDTDGEKFWWPPGETVKLCAGPIGKTVVPTPDTYLEGGEVREDGRRWINPGECVISKRRNS